METLVIISLCALLLFAYIFDITASKTKIPSVIFLLLLGFCVKQLTQAFAIDIPNLSHLLPALGSIGLILIVLEGAMELELNRSKFPVVAKTSLMALLPMLFVAFGLAWALYVNSGSTFKDALANTIPFAIISSAIAIPSVASQSSGNREFIIYESSLSDIFGVLLFNFVVLNDTIGLPSAGYFVLDLLVTLVITGIATLGLAFLLSKIKHHVKFVPIIISVILIYEIAKVFHLPGLIFILIFGLFLGNLDELRRFLLVRKLHPEILNDEMHRFKELTGEIAFLVRGTFFLLFGFLIDSQSLLDTRSMGWAVLITVSVFVARYLFLRLFRMPIVPLIWIAPRGLITILLFLSIPIEQVHEVVNQALVIQVILLTALVMMFGLIATKSEGVPTTTQTPK